MGSHVGADSGQPLIFISYSRKDAAWLERLQPYLKASLRQCQYSLWDDRGIKTGTDWFDEIGKAIAAAQVAILLVSIDFLASEFIEKHEVKPLLERAERGELTVFLIPVRYADWEDQPFAKFQAATDPTKPLAGMSDHEQDVTLTQIAKKLKKHLLSTPPVVAKPVPERPTSNPAARPSQAPGQRTAATAPPPKPVQAPPHQGAVAIPKPPKDAHQLWQDQDQWVYLPPGTFTMGGPPLEKQGRQETLDRGYWLARYPTTNAAFADFIRAGAYDMQGLWSEVGWQARQKESWTEPPLWDVKNFNAPDQPVVGVSFFEAEAFCNWLTMFGVQAWTGGREQVVSLPSERQWEYTARGTSGRVYPWGPQPPDQNHANFDHTVGKTTPVDRYPAGATPEGLMDLAGNCWEWCLDPWEAEASQRVVRGGSWADPARFLAASSRFGSGCGDRNGCFGFRCCLAAVPEHV